MAYYNFKNQYGEDMGANYYHRVCRASNFGSDGVPLVANNFYNALWALTLPRDTTAYNAIMRDRYGIHKLYNPANTLGVAVSVYKRNIEYHTGYPRNTPTYVPSASPPNLSVFSSATREYCTFDTNPVNFGLNILRTYTVPLNPTSFMDIAGATPAFIVGDLREGEAFLTLEKQHYTTQEYNESGKYWVLRTYMAVFRRTTSDRLASRFKLLYTGQGTNSMILPGPPATLKVAIVPDRADPDYVVSHL